MISQQNYHASLPQKRMGAGCLFFDEPGRVLLVKPGYKPGWEIPGGVVELNESPKGCCQREVLEEIGLVRGIGRLLVLDYNNPTETKSESLMFVFDGGVLSPQEITNIRLPAEELVDFGFFAQDELPATMTDTLRQRVLLAWQQVAQPGGIYLENQEKTSATSRE
jgi:ADP-ribose pyrophosphatase YjhB (NUDIX family)